VEIGDLQLDAEGLETDYSDMHKFLVAIGEFRSSIASSSASLINYAERYWCGERISSACIEANVNSALSKRFAKKQKMQWSRTGAQTLNGSLRSTFWQCYLAALRQSGAS
jgi:hypothetical protein